MLPRTRSHAAIKKAGSWTRLNTSSKRRSGSAAAQRCSFVCIVSTRAHADCVSTGHETLVFTSVSPSVHLLLPNMLDPFAMWSAFPTPDYYGSSAPSQPDQQDMRSAKPSAAGCGRRPAEPGRFPRSFLDHSTGSAPSYAPAPSPRLRRRLSPWPPDRRHHPVQEFPTRPKSCRCAMRPSPCPPGFGLVGSIEGLSATGSSRIPLRLASRARTIWQY